MTTRRTIWLLTALALGLGAPGALAQQGGFSLEATPEKPEPKPIFTKKVEGGLGYNSADSSRAGEYTGLTEDGPYAIGNIDVSIRDPYDSDGTAYWTLRGSNLGLDSRSVRSEFGRQGRYKVYFDYDQIPHFQIDDSRTPFRGQGSENLTLPPGWVSATDTAGLTSLVGSLHDVDIETERRRFGGGFVWHFSDEWSVKGNYRHEVKDGIETLAGIFGFAGGGGSGPLGAILPQPVDQTTDTADISLAYNTARLQAELRYDLSLYDNNAESLTWSNPFDALGGWDPSQDFDFGGQGRMALSPDNQAHQISLSAGYNVADSVRLVGNFAYGRMLQDDSFLPYTINSSLLVPTPLPRSNLDGRVDSIHANLAVTARPLQRLNLRAEYIYDNKDNQTPRDIYLTVPADSTDQAALISDRARINRPYSVEKHKVKVDAGYRVIPELKIGAGYDFELRSRTFSEVEDNYEHTGRVKLSFQPLSMVSGSVGYAASFRRGDDYTSNQPFLSSHNPAFLATLLPDELYENDPDLRKFYMADRDRHKLSGSLAVTPNDKLTIGFTGAYVIDDYNNTLVGLTDTTLLNLGVDATYLVRDDLELNGFAAYDTAYYRQVGYSRGGGNFPPGSLRNPDNFWTVKNDDTTYSAGIGVTWHPVKDKVDVSLNYVYALSNTEVTPRGGAAITFEPLPDVVTHVHSVSLTAGYRLTENATLRAGYWFEYYNSNDFSYDAVAENTIGQVITLGEASADYTAHIVGVWLSYEW